MTDGTMTRRAAMLGGTAFGLGACADMDSKNVWDILNSSRLKFVNDNGDPISPNAVKRLVDGRPVSVSFQFAACGDICPITGAALASASEQRPEVMHVIVAVDPLSDYANKNLRDIMISRGLRVGGDNPNTIIIYPTSNGRADDGGFIGAYDKIQQLQHRFNLFAESPEPEAHSGAVSVFDGVGNPVGRVTSPYRIPEEMPRFVDIALSRQTEKSRAR